MALTSAQGELYGVFITFIILTVIVTALRIYTRMFIKKALGADDILIGLATLVGAAGAITTLAATKYGLGEHLLKIAHIKDLLLMNKMIYGVTIGYAFTIAFAKLSIVTTYLRIFPQRGFKICMYVMAVVTILLCIGSLSVSLAVHWDWALHTRTQRIVIIWSYAYSSVNALTDFVLCLGPIPLFWQLNTNMRERIILCILFACGIVASVASIIRITELHTFESNDPTWDIIPTSIWTLIECGTGIICACIPSLKPLVKVIWPHSFFSTIGNSSVETGIVETYKGHNSSHGSSWQGKGQKSGHSSTMPHDSIAGSVLDNAHSSRGIRRDWIGGSIEGKDDTRSDTFELITLKDRPVTPSSPL